MLGLVLRCNVRELVERQTFMLRFMEPRDLPNRKEHVIQAGYNFDNGEVQNKPFRRKFCAEMSGGPIRYTADTVKGSCDIPRHTALSKGLTATIK